MEKLHKKFIDQNFSLRYSKLEVERMLVNEYSAKEITKESLSDLKNDPQVNFDHIFKCFKIDESTILKEIFNETEKMFQIEFINGREGMLPNSEWSRIQAGQLLRVILISEDGETLTDFTVQGMCMKLVNDLAIMKGISLEQCSLDNNYYRKYLQLLNSQGLL